MSTQLHSFFYPRSVAVIGASQNPMKPNGIPLYLLSMFSYPGEVYPVNPKYDRVGGLKCYQSVKEIEDPVDLAIIGVAAPQVMEILEECAEKKVKSVIIFTSGFAEVSEEGRKLQAEMKQLADSNGMRILGPNCLGLLNYYNGNMASFFYNQKRSDLVYPETLSFITQSGGLGAIIYQMVVQMSIGFNYFVSTGNEADVSFAEVLDYLVGRDEVSVVAGYLEGLQADGRLFIEACRKALERKKLVTMLKVGRTESGAKAAKSHTGAMVGEERVYDGLFKQFGVLSTEDVEQMNALISLYATERLPAGKRMAVITISGGGGVVVADKCPQFGLEVATITENTQQKLREFFPSYGAVANPVDLTSQLFVDKELFDRTLRLVMQDPEIDVGGFFYNLEMPDPEASNKIINAYRDIDKPLIVFTWPSGQDYALEAKNKLIQAGVPVIEHIPSGLWAISALADWHKKAGKSTAGSMSKQIGIIQEGGSNNFYSLLKEQLEDAGSRYLTEWRTRKLIEPYGIPLAKGSLAQTARQSAEVSSEIGAPLALKVMSPDLLHKTEFGGVILNVSSQNEAENAFGELVRRTVRHNPEARIEGILVQEMLKPGLEVMVGVKKDPVFGPAVAMGLGGVFVEIFEDVAIRIAPLSREDVYEMIDELKGKALFYGARNQPARDVEALIDIVVNLSHLAVEMEDCIDDIELNPVLVYEKGAGAIAADALIVAGVSEKDNR